MFSLAPTTQPFIVALLNNIDSTRGTLLNVWLSIISFEWQPSEWQPSEWQLSAPNNLHIWTLAWKQQCILFNVNILLLNQKTLCAKEERTTTRALLLLSNGKRRLRFEIFFLFFSSLSSLSICQLMDILVFIIWKIWFSVNVIPTKTFNINSSYLVRRKCPRWFVANCISNPSNK